jgi:hypothetical protein
MSGGIRKLIFQGLTAIGFDSHSGHKNLLSGWKTARQLSLMASGFKAIKIAAEDGDTKSVLAADQVNGLIDDEPIVVELMERTVEQDRIQRQILN